MASPTYTPKNAIDLVQNFVHGIPLAGVQALVCDMVNNMIWHYYPWSWTVGQLTAITCSDGIQDYSPVETDILRPLNLRLVRTDVSPNEARELGLLANLGVELTRKGGLEDIRSAGWIANTNKIRLSSATSISSPQVLQIQGDYQKTPTKIDDSQMGTALVMPDRYFETFVEGVKWKMYQLADDPRSGALTYAGNGAKQYSGQLAMFMESLATIARTEDLGNGDQFQFPESPLGTGRGTSTGIFGL